MRFIEGFRPVALRVRHDGKDAKLLRHAENSTDGIGKEDATDASVCVSLVAREPADQSCRDVRIAREPAGDIVGQVVDGDR